ncbi:MAG: VOC family protein [Chloroflexota bacterium]
MAQSVRPIPEGYHSLTPDIVVRGAAEAIEFYKRAFGAQELARMPTPDGKLVLHAELKIGDSVLMLSDEFPEMGGCRAPEALGGTTMALHLYVEDVDTVFQRALDAGAQVSMPLENMFWGDRYGKVTDPFGHQWSIATHVEDPTEEEMQKRMAASMAT